MIRTLNYAYRLCSFITQACDTVFNLLNSPCDWDLNDVWPLSIYYAYTYTHVNHIDTLTSRASIARTALVTRPYVYSRIHMLKIIYSYRLEMNWIEGLQVLIREPTSDVTGTLQRTKPAAENERAQHTGSRHGQQAHSTHAGRRRNTAWGSLLRVMLGPHADALLLSYQGRNTVIYYLIIHIIIGITTLNWYLWHTHNMWTGFDSLGALRGGLFWLPFYTSETHTCLYKHVWPCHTHLWDATHASPCLS